MSIKFVDRKLESVDRFCCCLLCRNCRQILSTVSSFVHRYNFVDRFCRQNLSTVSSFVRCFYFVDKFCRQFRGLLDVFILSTDFVDSFELCWAFLICRQILSTVSRVVGRFHFADRFCGQCSALFDVCRFVSVQIILLTLGDMWAGVDHLPPPLWCCPPEGGDGG